jgi:hypothetical protein
VREVFMLKDSCRFVVDFIVAYKNKSEKRYLLTPQNFKEQFAIIKITLEKSPVRRVGTESFCLTTNPSLKKWIGAE